MTDPKFLDPAQNPMIRVREDDWPLSDGEILDSVVEKPIDLPDRHGKWPGEEGYGGEKKAAAKSSSAPDADNTVALVSDLNRIADFMKGRTRYPVHSAQDDFLYDIVADGDNLLIENASGQRRKIKAGEVAAINVAISKEILRQKPDDESTDDLEQNISSLMPRADGGSYEITIEDGTPTPLFNIIRTADGKLEIKTSEGETKSFSDLTLLERKLIQHDFQTRKESWKR
jgi:hypothetical protein